MFAEQAGAGSVAGQCQKPVNSPPGRAVRAGPPMARTGHERTTTPHNRNAPRADPSPISTPTMSSARGASARLRRFDTGEALASVGEDRHRAWPSCCADRSTSTATTRLAGASILHVRPGRFPGRACAACRPAVVRRCDRARAGRGADLLARPDARTAHCRGRSRRAAHARADSAARRKCCKPASAGRSSSGARKIPTCCGSRAFSTVTPRRT